MRPAKKFVPYFFDVNYYLIVVSSEQLAEIMYVLIYSLFFGLSNIIEVLKTIFFLILIIIFGGTICLSI